MEKELIKSTFERVAPRKEEFAETFYRRLLEHNPEFRDFFARVDMRRQQSSLVATLGVIVRGIERGEDLRPVFRQIGRLHHERQIRAEHYPAFGNTLMETLAEFDPEWTPRHREAWAAALDLCVRGMMESYEPEATRYVLPVNAIKRKKTA